MQNSGPLPEGKKADISLQIQLPDEWDPNLAVKNVGITAGIEADRCHPHWITAARNMDRLIVPSTYSKESFINGGFDRSKIFNVPEGYTCSLKSTPSSKEFSDRLDKISTSFNFLIFGQITGRHAMTDRKNTMNMIKWLCEEFKNDKDVGIILKTNMGRLTCQDRRVTTRTVENILSVVRDGPYPRFHVLHGLMDREEISSLMSHEKVNALCAATRGEGWGLPILDATVNGLPVIATKHSGHMDFMKDVRFLDVDYKIEAIPDEMVDDRIWCSGAKWAQPSENHFKSRVKKLRKSPDVPREWAKKSMEKMANNYSMKSIAKKYDEALGDLIDCS